eukprot:TRINITY_DN1029_c0_g1_i6.p1 TRINITY_DN1029_c0_g1~~TRINITY_DN1029_c0_g1_i6.p1  ORF type:complete len:211 (-),score=25.60 TRINITY_DN1029_c0_g1_i6:444-1076(-)
MDTFENLSPVMSSEQAFDELLYAMNHQARKPTNIYYVSPEVVLRPHTSAHQIELIQAGHLSFLCTGDVYRRNQVNQTNYPVFHQMEGVHLFDEGVLEAKGDDTQQVAFITEDVKKLLETLVGSVLGHIEMRWSTVSFPYAEPAFQLQTLFKSMPLKSPKRISIFTRSVDRYFELWSHQPRNSQKLQSINKERMVFCNFFGPLGDDLIWHP